MDDTPTPELEAWMRRNRAARAETYLERKLAAATRARRASVLVPVGIARALLAVARSARS